jgi:hypothetical protein
VDFVPLSPGRVSPGLDSLSSVNLCTISQRHTATGWIGHGLRPVRDVMMRVASGAIRFTGAGGLPAVSAMCRRDDAEPTERLL